MKIDIKSQLAPSNVNLSSAEASLESANEAVIGNSANAIVLCNNAKQLQILGFRRYSLVARAFTAYLMHTPFL